MFSFVGIPLLSLQAFPEEAVQGEIFQYCRVVNSSLKGNCAIENHQLHLAAGVNALKLQHPFSLLKHLALTMLEGTSHI